VDGAADAGRRLTMHGFQCTSAAQGPTLASRRRKPLSEWENGLVKRVELRRLEPLTPVLPGWLMGIRDGPLLSVIADQVTVASSADICGRP